MEEDEARIKEAMSEAAQDAELACAKAFSLAEALGVPRATIGAYADDMQIRLVKCQLGLFGYKPEKKIVKPRQDVADELRRAIDQGLEDGRLPCKTAFAIASGHGIRKMDVSGACEALGIKIKPCQLGAF